MVFARARFDFSDRVCLALGPDRRTHRVEWNYSSARISSGGPRSTWRPRIVDLTDALLVQFERQLSPFSLRRRGRAIAASDFRDRARAVTRWVGCFLSFAHNRRPNISQFSMGHSSARNRVLVDFSRALAALAETRTRSSCFSRRDFSAQAPALQTHGDVRRGKTHQWR